MTEITDLSVTDSSNTEVTGESLDGSIANMGRMDNTLQAVMGLLARSIRTNVFRIIDFADPTKRIKWNLTGLPTATERELTAPYYSGTLGLVSDIRGQIYGLTLSNNVTDATNDIDIAAGAAVDSTGAVSMLLASSLTKRLDAAWAVGTGNGWLDTGSIANTTYHVFLIRRPDTGVVDSLASTSPTAPTLPANYTQFRRIGSIIRASGSITLFDQSGNDFIYRTPAADINIAVTVTTAQTPAITVPLGIRVKAHYNVIVRGGASATAFYFSDMRSTDNAASSVNMFTAFGGTQASAQIGAVTNSTYTDTSGRIRYRAENADANTLLRLIVTGYTDTRDGF